MASDDEDLGHSINDDLRMQGLRGDDESDLEADGRELFGSASVPIEVGDGDGHVAAPAAVPAPGAAVPTDVGINDNDGADTKRKRPSTSEAWNDFEKIYEVINGKRVRTGAKCFHCGQVYSGKSTIGTGHLLRHIKSCDKRKANIRQSQSLLRSVLMVVFVTGSIVLM